MLDISTIMKKYGFNESEIKVYLTLINHEQMTGYEVSKIILTVQIDIFFTNCKKIKLVVRKQLVLLLLFKLY